MITAASVELRAGPRLPLAGATDRLAVPAPTPRRMSPVTLPDGVTFVRDDFKAPIDSSISTFGSIRWR